VTVAVGIGYDSHRFEDGRRLVLGGVEIPHERGLAGHSDADVLAHAITDALLGAAGLGDIGTHFPDTDPAYRDAPSLDFLRTAIGMAGGTIVNIDATLICEEPRLGPHRAEIEASISGVTGSRFNLKATTNEGMGWIGRGEGMACMAVVSLELP
jgi:2-C-methyl-D-erythritol 2,4-cyclodiphosphate synthase